MRTINPSTNMPMTNKSAQHKPISMSVRASGGPVREGEGASCVDCAVEDVGTGVTVACCTKDPPAIGTIVGTKVGVGCTVG